jgi:pyruvate dehydrogenase E2 component (dihydrolipoamide acetyltransferase)
MPVKILMPALSPTMTEGNLAKWLKKEGDKVSPGEVIAEIETDKATMEVEAVDEGIMGKILVQAGTENVPVNSLIALLLEEGEEKSALDSFKIEQAPPPSPEVPENAKGRENKISQDENKPTTKSEPTSNRIFASPLARRIASLEGVDLRYVQGSGPNGRIIKADVLSSKSNAKPSGVRRNPEEERLVPNNNIRKIIAKRLLESKQTVPHFYLSIECNMDRLLELRQDINCGIEGDKKVSVNDLIIKASAMALLEVPEANASWTDAAIVYYNNIDISVAVAIEGGLITPILRNADQKAIYSIATESKALIKKARENKLTPEEFQGGGFSISNLGMFGIKKFSAIINPPQSCILAIGESSKRPVIIDDQIRVSTMMDVTLSCDHRVVDGAVGAKLLDAFKKFIERPVLMLMER